MAKSKAMESLEQWGGHFLLLGIVLATIHPSISIGVYLIREFTDWQLPWPMKGQWPPGDIAHVHKAGTNLHTAHLPYDRVEDLRRDSIFTLIGTMIGGALHELILLLLTLG